jgi:hypothetical protein
MLSSDTAKSVYLSGMMANKNELMPNITEILLLFILVPYLNECNEYSHNFGLKKFEFEVKIHTNKINLVSNYRGKQILVLFT